MLARHGIEDRGLEHLVQYGQLIHFVFAEHVGLSALAVGYLNESELLALTFETQLLLFQLRDLDCDLCSHQLTLLISCCATFLHRNTGFLCDLLAFVSRLQLVSKLLTLTRDQQLRRYGRIIHEYEMVHVQLLL
ncbi:MAG: hypothetical protein CMO26_04225 [Thiotrichales bacterium]|nr:hypothetical protein [Thiotrichales bacterium]